LLEQAAIADATMTSDRTLRSELKAIRSPL
jgi:hypothetical protein